MIFGRIQVKISRNHPIEENINGLQTPNLLELKA